MYTHYKKILALTLALLGLAGCSVNPERGGEAEDLSGYKSVIEAGFNMSAADAGIELSKVLQNNPSESKWLFPEGVLNFESFPSPDLLSSKVFRGSPDARTVLSFKGDRPKDITLKDIQRVTFKAFSFENVRFYISGSSRDVSFEANIFYGLRYNGTSDSGRDGKLNTDYFLEFGDYSSGQSAVNIKIQHNIFLRGKAKKKAYSTLPLPELKTAADEADSGYMSRREYGIRLMSVSNILIADNIFGLDLNTIDRALSFTADSILKININMAKEILKQEPIQTYFTTCINAIPNPANTNHNAKYVRVLRNYFKGWWNRDYLTDALISGTQPSRDDNRFFDHALYLRGSENVIVAGCLLEGWPNDSAGSLKFKSGINLVVANNRVQNGGLIFDRDYELGAGSSVKMGLYSNVLVVSNVLSPSDAIGSRVMGITFNDSMLRKTEASPAAIDAYLPRIRYFLFLGNTISYRNVSGQALASISGSPAAGTENLPSNPALLRLDDISPALAEIPGVSASTKDIVRSSGLQVSGNKYGGGARLVEDRTVNPAVFLYPETPEANVFPVKNLYKGEWESIPLPKQL